jgi:hypothetical protein
MKQSTAVGVVASRILGVIRLVNGALGLFAPQVLVRRLSTEHSIDEAALYPFRMFGIRTLVLGVHILTARGPSLRRASLVAVLIHGTDTLSATIGAIRGEVSPRTARLTITISAANALLALIAYRALPRDHSGRGRS